MAEVCARPHPEDVSEACSATLLVPRSCSASTGEIVALRSLAMLRLSCQILTFYRDYNNGTLPSETWQRCKMTDDSQYRESR
jgi:hypothetical protein